MANEELEWPEYLAEREPANDVERINEDFKAKGVEVKSRLEGSMKANLKPGDRVQLHWQQMELEMSGDGLCSILVEGDPVWSGRPSELEDVTTYSSSIDKTLCGVCVNGTVVWVRG